MTCDTGVGRTCLTGTGIVNPYAVHQQHQQGSGPLSLNAQNFNRHNDVNFKRQVSFFINNVRIEKNDNNFEN